MVELWRTSFLDAAHVHSKRVVDPVAEIVIKFTILDSVFCDESGMRSLLNV